MSNYSDKDKKYIEIAINMAEQSLDNRSFPAGAVIVYNDEVISQTTSASFPKINFHAESKAIDEAITQLNQQLSSCVLYASMQPCLMCLSRAYWAGIRKIFFAVNRNSVPYKLCYEGNHSTEQILKEFNEEIELINIPEFEGAALKPVNEWLKQNT